MPHINLSILNILVLFGSLQGIILAFILISTSRFRRKSNYFLALLILTISLLSFMLTLEELEFWDVNSLIACLPVVWLNLIPPAIFYFIKYLIDPDYKFRNIEYLFFIPFLFEFLHSTIRLIHFLNGEILTPEQAQQHYLISNIFETIAVLGTIGVNIYFIYQLKKYEEKLYDNYSEVEDHSLTWLRYTLIAGLVLSILWSYLAISDFSPGPESSPLVSIVMLGLALLIYWIGYSMIIRQGLLETPIFAIAETQSSNGNNTELSTKTDAHYEKLIALIEEDKLYRDPNLNMSVLSKRTGLSNGYLSQIINQKRGQNFFDLINSYRIDEVKKNMVDDAYTHFSILGLAQEAGFKSKSTFNSVFKKMTGKTPTDYKKSQ